MKNFLSHKEKIDLKIQHKTEKNGRVRDRIKAILLDNNRSLSKLNIKQS